MPDRERVFSGLEHCSEDGCKGCPYAVDCTMADGFSELAKDVLELLKEQEAVKPVKQIEQREWTVCGNCRNHIISKWIFCPYCGRAVKWDVDTPDQKDMV